MPRTKMEPPPIRLFISLIFLCVFLSTGWSGDVSSLSRVFQLGGGIEDRDEDGHAESVALRVVVPDNPTAEELMLAADIAARANLESLAVDFYAVVRESEIKDPRSIPNPILIGSRLIWVQKLLKKGRLDGAEPSTHQGRVSVFDDEGQRGIVLFAGSPDAMLRTGRAFFLRWPYFWEVWGREEGATYFRLEEDLGRFFEQKGVDHQQTRIVQALYDFPPDKSPHEAIKRLKFDRGEIQNLVVQARFQDEEERTKAARALEALQRSHRRGQQTEVLTYPGCAQISFQLLSSGKATTVTLPRVGYPKRMLTPSYKPVSRTKITGKDFDLTALFSTRGLYADGDKDGILDGVDAIIITPQDLDAPSITRLASRLVLPTAGASFPLVWLDREIEEPKTLKAPILVGRSNQFYQDLLKTGKTREPSLEVSWGMVQVIPEAFNPSHALAVIGRDKEGLDKTLAYLAQTFPHIKEFGEGSPSVSDLAAAVEEFFAGKRGSAEAYFLDELNKVLEQMEDKAFESFKVGLYLPQKNKKFADDLGQHLKKTIETEELEIETKALRDSRTVFSKNSEFIWEGDEALELIQSRMDELVGSDLPVRIHLGLSESPSVRQKLEERVKTLLCQNGVPDAEVEVLCAYKPGFFWLLERVLPAFKDKSLHRLTIRVAEEKEDLTRLKRFYAEPTRWLQELYPIDEILARELRLPLDRITFELKDPGGPVYEVLGFDESGALLGQHSFAPRTREALFLKALPEWGKVKRTTGWLQITAGEKTVLETMIQTDLERFWDFYQDEVLKDLYSYILDKTKNRPTFAEQPYFKRLLVEMFFSEPDYRLGLDEEIVSSLEAIHDELYFDTLDFLRGITDVQVEEEDIPEDTSRYSAPGNILPLIHPSLEGQGGRVKVTLEEPLAKSSKMVLKWKERDRQEMDRTITFPTVKPKGIRLTALTYNGQKERVENVLAETELDKEKDYLLLIRTIDALHQLHERDVIDPGFRYPGLGSLTLRLKHKDWVKEVTFTLEDEQTPRGPASSSGAKEVRTVPTDEIISPHMCLEFVEHLGRFPSIKTFIAGRSYEDREIPVLEVFLPQGTYVSIPRLVTAKPSIYLSGRQHANEVSATNTILKLAELLATDPSYKDYLKAVNFVLHPMENPDGAELAYELQKITPFHSLHAGRYTSLGIDVGYQVSVSKPLLPEAKVRRYLYDKWIPDIYLNLHGYPSHEWVQPFSNYVPYLFRDYWIPRGWFAYFNAVTLPVYQPWKEAAEDLKGYIIREINAEAQIQESNAKFYDRYYRWAARWQPHLDYLEIEEGVNLYAKRRSSRENRLTPRRRMTFVEETPELMDETARGSWLEFLCEQSLAYLRAHIKYLAQVRHETARIEEESEDRIHIQFVRGRPGSLDR